MEHRNIGLEAKMLVETQKDPVVDLLQTIARQDQEAKMTDAIEQFADDLLMAEMELARARKAQRLGLSFIPRDQMFSTEPPAHPADRAGASA